MVDGDEELLVPLACPSCLTLAERTSIVPVVAEDLGYSDVSFNGRGIDTPKMDSLAKGGLRFIQFYKTD